MNSASPCQSFSAWPIVGIFVGTQQINILLRCGSVQRKNCLCDPCRAHQIKSIVYRGSFSAMKAVRRSPRSGRANEINALEPRPAGRRHFFGTSVTLLDVRWYVRACAFAVGDESAPLLRSMMRIRLTWDTAEISFRHPDRTAGPDRCTHRGKWLDSRSLRP
jgi:hypothetical protein